MNTAGVPIVPHDVDLAVQHSCPHRVAITVEAFNRDATLADRFAYAFDLEAYRLGLECWRQVEGVDLHLVTKGAPVRRFDVWFTSGRCRENVPGDALLFLDDREGHIPAARR